MPEYEKSSFASKDFYSDLKKNNLIHILDCNDILKILQSAYYKSHILPANVELRLESKPLQQGNVYIGIVSSTELKSCHDEFGDALFLENIRDFIGIDSIGKQKSGKRKNGHNREKEKVNNAILDTVEKEPEKMLARNNGITFRAEKVKMLNEHTLLLSKASIVNGCQTTMCAIRSPKNEACVLVKIVETDDSWDIAHAANFQNSIQRIELDLARFIRPQTVKSSGFKHGVQIPRPNSPFDVLSEIYQPRVAYDEIYSVFIGLFSSSPNNAIGKNYTEMNYDLLEEFQEKDDNGEETFKKLFKLHEAAELGVEEVKKIYTDGVYAPLFKRFWQTENANYRSFITILAACGSIRNNIYVQQNGKKDFQAINNFLDQVVSIIENHKNKFVRYYQLAFEVVASKLIDLKDEDAKIRQDMYEVMRKANFKPLYMILCLKADGDPIIRN
ncbi:AIPR family protein [Coleofasciculus sp. FACHB-SPT9]|uniref:AIPR family protein n=1 Tax=Cyanophyceae TaxID=3028117 RepID=UPI0016844E83|nr:AIPR family protein [Coleofasciculus sp. FACHB-SPT9]MBD1891517.1 AIPR family protein [Coleofasciculus sp. FACHB-SPT9]